LTHTRNEAEVTSGYLGPDDLILSHFCLGRHRDFQERVSAAADAGFRGIGMYVGEYARLRAEGQTDAELRAILTDHGVRVVELEVLRGWCGGDRERYLQSEQAVFAMNDALGPAHHVQVIGPYDGTIDDAAEAFAGICDRAAERGLTAAIEFFPEMSNIPDAGVAWQIASLAGRANGGLNVDIWHHVRGGGDDNLLRAVPGDRVFAVQISDGPRTRQDADYYTDTTRHRVPLGQGDFDVVGFLGVMDAIGVRLPLSVEVLSAQFDAMPARDVTRLLAESTRTVVAAARSAATTGGAG
jgi:sugar phosphate isomerase/epimerase